MATIESPEFIEAMDDIRGHMAKSPEATFIYGVIAAEAGQEGTHFVAIGGVNSSPAEYIAMANALLHHAVDWLTAADAPVDLILRVAKAKNALGMGMEMTEHRER